MWIVPQVARRSAPFVSQDRCDQEAQSWKRKFRPCIDIDTVGKEVIA
jgi:hypothetical protein